MNPENTGNRFKIPKDTIEIIANLTQILSFVFSLFTAIVLTAQPEPPKIPGVNFSLDYPLQMAFIFCILLGYMQYVRHQIYNARRKEGAPLFDPLSVDLIIRRPLLLTPIIILIVLLYRVDYLLYENSFGDWETGMATIPAILLFIPLLELSNLVDRTALKSSQFNEWEKDEILKQRWVSRIREKLKSDGKVHTKSFPDIGLKGSFLYRQTEWAIGNYFDQFEIEEGLSLVEKEIEKGFNGLVLQKKNLITTVEVKDGEEKQRTHRDRS